MTDAEAQRIARHAASYIKAAEVVHSLRSPRGECELEEEAQIGEYGRTELAGRAACVWRVEVGSQIGGIDDEDDEVCDPCKATLAKRAGLAAAKRARGNARTRMRRAVKAVQS